MAVIITAAQAQLFSGKITNFLNFLRPRRIPPQRHFVTHNPKPRRAQHPRPARKAIRPNYPKNTEEKFARAPVLKHYKAIAAEPPTTPQTTTQPLTSKPPTTTPYPIILITSTQAIPIPYNPKATDWQPISADEYPALFEAVTPVKIQKNLLQLTTDRGEDGQTEEIDGTLQFSNFILFSDVGMVGKFSLFIRPDQPASDGQEIVSLVDEEDRDTTAHDKDGTALDLLYAPVSASIERHNDGVVTEDAIEQENDNYDENAAYPRNVNGDDLGEKDMSIEEVDYHATSKPEYSNNIHVDDVIDDDSHVEMKDFSDEEAFDDYQPIYSNYYNSEEYSNDELYEVDNNHIDDEVMELEDLHNKETVEMYVETDKASDTSIYGIEENGEPLRDDEKADEDYKNDNHINPQFKTDLPDSNFKTDFFHSENIQNLVFSIPEQFRTFLQEPPTWINKDYW